MDKEAFDKMLKISEEYFGTANDPDQIPISKEAGDKIRSIHPETILYKFNKGNPIAWEVIIPTSLSVMNNFLHKKISERVLFEIAVKEKKHEALYLCSAFVLPEYRGRGYAKELIMKGIATLSQNKELPLYCWIYSNEGKNLVDSLSKTLGKTIQNRDE